MGRPEANGAGGAFGETPSRDATTAPSQAEPAHAEPVGAEPAGAPTRSEPAEPSDRLFVAIWPPPAVVGALAGALASHGRPAAGAVRWTTPDQWHVTVAFLGTVPRSRVGEVGSVLVAAVDRAAAAPEACLGPMTERLGRRVLCVPVRGIDDVARRVRLAMGSLFPDAGLDEPFQGHLTLARARGRRTVPSSLAGAPLEARWRVRELDLVRSELDEAGARYTTLVTATVRS